MKIYSWELLNIMFIFPSIFATTLIFEGIYKISKSNKLGLISLVIGLLLVCVLIVSYAYFFREKP